MISQVDNGETNLQQGFSIRISSEQVNFIDHWASEIHRF